MYAKRIEQSKKEAGGNFSVHVTDALDDTKFHYTTKSDEVIVDQSSEDVCSISDVPK